MVFQGEYDLGCKDRLRTELARLSGDAHVILDFSSVRYLDSTCLSELIHLNRIRREKGFPPETIVVGASAMIRRLLVLTRLDTLFHVSDSIERALEETGGDASFQHCFSGGEI